MMKLLWRKNRISFCTLARNDVEFRTWIDDSTESKIFCASWKTENPIASICMIHGYGDHCMGLNSGTALKYAQAGYVVYALDLPGFGRSEGLHGFIPDFNKMVEKAHKVFCRMRQSTPNIPSFLHGESMGGTVALEIHKCCSQAWSDGAIMISPMCKIDKEMYPPAFLISSLQALSKIAPTLPITPVPDVLSQAMREESAILEAKLDKLRYSKYPRLGTAQELLSATERLEATLHEITLPFIVLHGLDDKVTSWEGSKMLYNAASTADKDKEMWLYPHLCHALLHGEKPSTCDRVFKDIIEWLDRRCGFKRSIAQTFSNQIVEWEENSKPLEFPYFITTLFSENQQIDQSTNSALNLNQNSSTKIHPDQLKMGSSDSFGHIYHAFSIVDHLLDQLGDLVDDNSTFLELGSGRGENARRIVQKVGCRVFCVASKQDCAINDQMNREFGFSHLIRSLPMQFHQIPIKEHSIDFLWSQDILFQNKDALQMFEQSSTALKKNGRLFLYNSFAANPIESAMWNIECREKFIEMARQFELELVNEQSLQKVALDFTAHLIHSFDTIEQFSTQDFSSLKQRIFRWRNDLALSNLWYGLLVFSKKLTQD